jgi:putative hydrolase of the HAD superfamily
VRVSPEPIEAVIWDYGGVISTPPFRGIGAFEREHGYPPGSVLELIFGDRAYIGAGGGGDPGDGTAPEAASVVHDWHRLEIGELTMVEYMTGVAERAPEVIGRPLDFDAYRRFMRDMPIGVHWPVVHRIRELKQSGIRVALLTNNVKEFGEGWRSTFPVDELFEIVVDSSAVGMRKPDPRIYRLTCAQIDATPTVSVFLDDNLDNVNAARALGMEGVQVGEDPFAAIAELDAILERRGTRAVT